MKCETSFPEMIRHDAERVFCDCERARAWLGKRRGIWGGRTARERAEDDAGYLTVKDVLERLDHEFGI